MVGRRDPSEYREIIAIVVAGTHLNPAPGQGFDEDLRIECGREVERLPVGTKVRIKVVEKNPKSIHDRPHLYSSYKWPYEIVK